MRTNPHIIWGISYPLHGSPQYMCDAQNNADTWHTYTDCRPEVSISWLNGMDQRAPIYRGHSLPLMIRSRRGHHYRESWPKISLSSSRAIRAQMSPPGIEPQTPCTIGRYSRKELSRQLILLSIRSTIYADKSPHYLGDFLPTTIFTFRDMDKRPSFQVNWETG